MKKTQQHHRQHTTNIIKFRIGDIINILILVHRNTKMLQQKIIFSIQDVHRTNQLTKNT